MRDKSLDIFLMVIFGIPGIAILVLAWIQPMTASERILSNFIGSAGLFMVLTRALLLKSLPTGTDAEPVPVEANAEDKP